MEDPIKGMPQPGTPISAPQKSSLISLIAQTSNTVRLAV